MCRSIMDKGSLEVFLNADCWRCLLNCQCFLLFLSIGTYKCFADCWRCLLNCQCFPRFLSIGTCPISGCGISGDTKEAVALFRQQTNTQIFYQRRHVQIFWNTHTYITIGQKVNVCKWVLAIHMVCRCSGWFFSSWFSVLKWKKEFQPKRTVFVFKKNRCKQSPRSMSKFFFI